MSTSDRHVEGLMVLDAAGQVALCSDVAAAIFGYAPPELQGTSLAALLAPGPNGPPSGPVVLERLIQAGPTGLKLNAVRRDRRIFPVELQCVEHRVNGSRLVIALARDASASSRAGRLQRARAAASRVMAEPGSAQEVVPKLLEGLCHELGWAFGALWQEDGTGGLTCRSLWVCDEQPFTEFVAATRRATVGFGIGLPGRIWCGRSPTWIADTRVEHAFPRLAVAAREGLRVAFGFPVVLGQSFLGVIELFGHDVEEPDPSLLELAANLGREVAQFLERKRIEDERDRFFNMSLNLFAIADRSANFWRANDAWGRALGVTPAELAYRPLWEMMCPEERGRAQAAIDRLNAGEDLRDYEARFCHRDGSVRWLSLSCAAPEAGAEWIYLAARDVTSNKQAEAELRQAQKLEAVGQLAAGIAHEINTPIQFVGDSAHFLRDALGDLTRLIASYQEVVAAVERGEATAEHALVARQAEQDADLEYLREQLPKAVDRTLEGTSRVADIVRAMKEFAHPDQKEKVAANLNRALSSTLTVAKNEVKYVAEVVTDFQELPPVFCHLGDLNQVFLNLLVNAAHAIADVVGTSGERGLITVRSRCDGPDVVVEISDTGTGIPEEIRARIFDPFFTTKPVGKGTGQGLAIARSIVVDKHGGSISLESELGRGTTFVIRLPIENKGGTMEHRAV